MGGVGGGGGGVIARIAICTAVMHPPLNARLSTMYHKCMQEQVDKMDNDNNVSSRTSTEVSTSQVQAQAGTWSGPCLRSARV